MSSLNQSLAGFAGVVVLPPLLGLLVDSTGHWWALWAVESVLVAGLRSRLGGSGLTAKTIESMADGLVQIAKLPDPIGEIIGLKYRPSGIQVGQMRVPLGVVGIIYESRPNVTADAAGLCVKSGNAAILRGGSEAIHSNQAIAACVHEGLKAVGLPETAVQVIETTDRAAVGELITMQDYVDVIVPRGGKSLIERLMRESRIPMIKHLHGVCHVYIDDRADIDKAIRIADNAKTQRLGTCNTMETLLVARGIAEKVLPPLCRIYREKDIELRGDDAARRIVPQMKPADEEDWFTEYLDAILSVRIVEGLDQAIELAKHYEAKVDVVSVVPFHPGRAPVDPWDDHVVHAEELRDAKAILEESLEISERAGSPAAVSSRLDTLGENSIRLGRYTEAERHLERSLALRPPGEAGRRWVMKTYDKLAALCLDTGRYAEGLKHLADLAGTAAGLAGVDRRPWLGAVAATALAGGDGLEADLASERQRRRLERRLHVNLVRHRRPVARGDEREAVVLAERHPLGRAPGEGEHGAEPDAWRRRDARRPRRGRRRSSACTAVLTGTRRRSCWSAR